ncbi:unnamed protein product, partial [Rotaria sp. Silwood1]
MLGVFTIVITVHQQKMAREQRLEDLNESRYQRQREESRQGELATSQYQDELLVAYIKDMAKYLEKGNGSLTSNNVMATVARVKTLNIFRQLDPQRNVRIIRFLYEAGQLTKTQERPSLDISTAELRDIDFRDSAINKKKLNNITLTDIFLSNASFIEIEMEM